MNNRTDSLSVHRLPAPVRRASADVPEKERSAPAVSPKNTTGMPDRLKAGVESLSGMSMDDVKVHYRSGKPAQMQARAYAQGSDIHLGPGQERHLPHEAWHVVQQKQGRVKPTMQLKGAVNVNDDRGLEKEADVMGQKALRRQEKAGPYPEMPVRGTQVAQRSSFEDFDSYADAKNATIYSKALLDEQKNTPIEEFFGKKFDNKQQEKIYKANKEHYKSKEIISDSNGATLYRQDMKVTPHIDHRYPKSRGGTNHYVNAAVLPAGANISKGSKLVLGKEPDTPLAPYAGLSGKKSFEVCGGFMEFGTQQRKDILEANTNHYGKGGPVSDEDGKTVLSPYDTQSVPHIDHITARAEGGTNFYFNAEVLPAGENLSKSGKKGLNMDIDSKVGSMTLVKYYTEKKKKGISRESAIFAINNDSEEEDVDSEGGLYSGKRKRKKNE